MGMYATLYRVDAKQLVKLHEDPEEIFDFMDQARDNKDAWLELDKTWHGLHFLLTGTAWEPRPPLDFIASGGQPIGEEDVGYGPARSLDPKGVREAWTAMEPLDEAALRKRFDPPAMSDVYPSIWDRDPSGDDTLGWLLATYPNLRAFVQAAAERGDGIVVTIV